MTYREMIREAAGIFETAGIAEASYDAKQLLCFMKDWNDTAYLFHADENVSPEEYGRYRLMYEKRAAHVPLQHITGKAWFYGYEFSVDGNVLIPRYDTEILVEEAFRQAEKQFGALKERPSVLDLCTGSGCIAAVLAKSGLFSQVTASDLSEAALAAAGRNCTDLGAAVEFIKSDLFDELNGQFDMIVSNPPYIASDTIETLEAEVREHDPRMALDGGRDGLLFYRRIASEAGKYLKKNGCIILEIGDEQADDVTELLSLNGYHGIRVIRDLNLKDRVISCLTD